MADTERLVKLLQEKNVDAFEQLHDMYAENICGAINIIINDTSVSSELCQDVFLKVWQKSHMYDATKGRFFTWLLNVARNQAKDYVTSKEYKSQKQNHSIDLFTDIYESAQEEQEDNQFEGLKGILNNLKSKCSELIKLLYFNGCTQNDAAEMLSIPLGTVKSRNRNCLNTLRNTLNND